jgi:hypothetical protein
LRSARNKLTKNHAEKPAETAEPVTT